MNENIIKSLLEKEFKNIYEKYWLKILNNEYIELENTMYHRTKLIDIKNIRKIKDTIEDKLGIIGPYIFITSFCNNITFPGPHNNIEKILCLIYHLLDGCSIHQMDKFIDDTTFYRIYHKLYIKNEEQLNKWIDYMYEYFFSNINIRILTGKIKNPELLKNVTLLLDGHHNKIIYENIDVDRRDLYSWKLNKPGLNTQFVIDNNGMVLYISDSLPCKNNNDDIMFINNVKLNKFFKHGDCICFDGLYNNTLKEVIEKYESIGLSISYNNFLYPIKKQKNIPLNKDEFIFNKQLGGYRSDIETYFADLAGIFKRFYPQNNVRVTKLKTYNIQLKLACLFMNIKKFTELGNITPNDLHKKWINDGFDFPNKKRINIESSSVSFKLENIEKIGNYHNEAILKILHDNSYEHTNVETNIIDVNTEDLIMNDLDVGNKVFEVSYIIKHKNNNDGSKEYFVKWKGYNKSNNSWVKKADFTSKDIINDYWNSIS